MLSRIHEHSETPAHRDFTFVIGAVTGFHSHKPNVEMSRTDTFSFAHLVAVKKNPLAFKC
jgi:hypothetical protein